MNSETTEALNTKCLSTDQTLTLTGEQPINGSGTELSVATEMVPVVQGNIKEPLDPASNISPVTSKTVFSLARHPLLIARLI